MVVQAYQFSVEEEVDAQPSLAPSNDTRRHKNAFIRYRAKRFDMLYALTRTDGLLKMSWHRERSRPTIADANIRSWACEMRAQ